MSKARRRELEIVQDDISSLDDKRVFCRFGMDEIAVRCKDLKSGNRISGKCEDFSAGGIGFNSETEINTKTPLEMWIDFPDGFDPIHLLGKVVWARLAGKSRWHFGIAFDSPRLMSLARVMKAQATE